MNLSKLDVSAILDSIAYTISAIHDPSDSESVKACANYHMLAERIESHEASFTLGEIVNICKALDIFIQDSGEAAGMHVDLFERLSASVPPERIQW